MIDEVTITRLVNEAANTVPIMTVYDMALKNIDFVAMQAAQPMTQEELCANMAMAGFIAGIRFTLENLEMHEDGAEIAGEAAGSPISSTDAAGVSLHSEVKECAPAASDGRAESIIPPNERRQEP